MATAGKSLRDLRWEQKKMARDARIKDPSLTNLPSSDYNEQNEKINGVRSYESQARDNFESQAMQERLAQDKRSSTLQDYLPPIRTQERLAGLNSLQYDSDNRAVKHNTGNREQYVIDPGFNRMESIEKMGNGIMNSSFDRRGISNDLRNQERVEEYSPFVRSIGLDEKRRKAEYGEFLRQQMRAKELQRGSDRRRMLPDIVNNGKGGFSSDKEHERQKKQEYGDFLKYQMLEKETRRRPRDSIGKVVPVVDPRYGYDIFGNPKKYLSLYEQDILKAKSFAPARNINMSFQEPPNYGDEEEEDEEPQHVSQSFSLPKKMPQPRLLKHTKRKVAQIQYPQEEVDDEEQQSPHMDSSTRIKEIPEEDEPVRNRHIRHEQVKKKKSVPRLVNPIPAFEEIPEDQEDNMSSRTKLNFVKYGDKQSKKAFLLDGDEPRVAALKEKMKKDYSRDIREQIEYKKRLKQLETQKQREEDLLEELRVKKEQDDLAKKYAYEMYGVRVKSKIEDLPPDPVTIMKKKNKFAISPRQEREKRSIDHEKIDESEDTEEEKKPTKNKKKREEPGGQSTNTSWMAPNMPPGMYPPMYPGYPYYVPMPVGVLSNPALAIPTNPSAPGLPNVGSNANITNELNDLKMEIMKQHQTLSEQLANVKREAEDAARTRLQKEKELSRLKDELRNTNMQAFTNPVDNEQTFYQKPDQQASQNFESQRKQEFTLQGDTDRSSEILRESDELQIAKAQVMAKMNETLKHDSRLVPFEQKSLAETEDIVESVPNIAEHKQKFYQSPKTRYNTNLKAPLKTHLLNDETSTFSKQHFTGVGAHREATQDIIASTSKQRLDELYKRLEGGRSEALARTENSLTVPENMNRMKSIHTPEFEHRQEYSTHSRMPTFASKPTMPVESLYGFDIGGSKPSRMPENSKENVEPFEKTSSSVDMTDLNSINEMRIKRLEKYGVKGLDPEDKIIFAPDGRPKKVGMKTQFNNTKSGLRSTKSSGFRIHDEMNSEISKIDKMLTKYVTKHLPSQQGI